METKKKTDKSTSVPVVKEPHIDPLVDPEELIVPEEDPDIIPDEDPFATIPYEAPEPGEGP